MKTRRTIHILDVVPDPGVFTSLTLNGEIKGNKKYSVTLRAGIHNELFIKRFTTKQKAKKFYKEYLAMANKEVIDEHHALEQILSDLRLALLKKYPTPDGLKLEVAGIFNRYNSFNENEKRKYDSF